MIKDDKAMNCYMGVTLLPGPDTWNERFGPLKACRLQFCSLQPKMNMENYSKLQKTALLQSFNFT